VDRSFLVTVHRDLAASTSDDRSLTGWYLPVVVNIAFSEIILELFGDVDVLLHVVERRTQRHA